MALVRRAGWFVVVAMAMACWTGVLGGLRGVAEAGVIASRVDGAGDLRAADLAKVQALLERKVVLQRLADHGVSPQEAMAKVRGMSDSDLHRFASLSDRVPAGGDSVIGTLVALAILAILIIVIIKLLDKEIIIR